MVVEPVHKIPNCGLISVNIIDALSVKGMDMTKTRIPSHLIEERAVSSTRLQIGQHQEMLYRECSGRDYGYDGLIEIFDEGAITGKFALVQIKGVETWSNLKILKNRKYITQKISITTAGYAVQNRIPLFVIIASADKKENGFYYVLLQKSTSDKKFQKRMQENKKSVNIHIPFTYPAPDNANNLYQEMLGYLD